MNGQLGRLRRLVRGIEPTTRTRRRLDGWAAAAGVLVLVACSFAVRDGVVRSTEKSVFEVINGWPEWLEVPLWVFQLLGLLVMPLLLAVVAYAAGRRHLAAGLALVGPLKLLLERAVVKQLVERQRPGTTIPGAIIRDASVAGLSFPSGHATIAFAIATLVAPYLTRRWQIVWFVLAALNGLARIYLGAHNPLDVVGGAALGVAIGSGLNLVLSVPAKRR